MAIASNRMYRSSAVHRPNFKLWPALCPSLRLLLRKRSGVAEIWVISKAQEVPVSGLLLIMAFQPAMRGRPATPAAAARQDWKLQPSHAFLRRPFRPHPGIGLLSSRGPSRHSARSVSSVARWTYQGFSVCGIDVCMQEHCPGLVLRF